MNFLHVATDSEVKECKTTDIYFLRTYKILEKRGLSRKRVTMEFTAESLPNEWEWGVLTGTNEFIKLFEKVPVDLYMFKEGTVFKPKDENGVRAPVAFIEGPYKEFCMFETPALGLICQSTGVSTAAAHIKVKAWNKVLLAFGARRMHPAISPMLDWAAYVGGFDAVSTIKGAELIGQKPVGTMPHALVLVFGEQTEAWKAFDEVVEPETPRIMLVDTLFDEKTESILAAETLKDKLYGVRLDTPSSRKGEMGEIIEEVRWELNIRGFKHVKIFVSGGINEKNIDELIQAGADGFGIGTSLSNAPTVNFAADIVRVDDKPFAKRGKFSGKKQVWRCEKCFNFKVTSWGVKEQKCSKCGGEMTPLLEKVIEKGEIKIKLPNASRARDYVIKQLEKIKQLELGK